MYINLGSANKQKEGWINIDIQDSKNVDALCDLSLTPYEMDIKEKSYAKFGEFVTKTLNGKDMFLNNTVDKIMAIEFLEHLSFRDTVKVLKEWYRILKPEGKVLIQVPDIDKCIKYYVNSQVCECVPHKAENAEGYKADKKCFYCSGLGKINPTRFVYSFLGAQKHPWDLHRNIFTPNRMKDYLSSVGFRNIKFQDDLYKIKVICKK